MEIRREKALRNMHEKLEQFRYITVDGTVTTDNDNE